MSTPELLLIDQPRVIHCTATAKTAAASQSATPAQDVPRQTLTAHQLGRGEIGAEPHEGGIERHQFLLRSGRAAEKDPGEAGQAVDFDQSLRKLDIAEGSRERLPRRFEAGILWPGLRRGSRNSSPSIATAPASTASASAASPAVSPASSRCRYFSELAGRLRSRMNRPWSRCHSFRGISLSSGARYDRL